MWLRALFYAALSPFERKGEPPDELLRKQLLVPTTVIGFVSVILNIAWTSHPVSLSLLIPWCMKLAITGGGVMYVLVTKTFPLWVAEVFIVTGSALFIFLDDLQAYGTTASLALVVPMIDLLLMCQCRRKVADGFVKITAVYIIGITAEQHFRFGLYDALPETGFDLPPEACSPPSVFHFVVLSRLFSVLLDYVMTRHFAYSMQAEQERVRGSVRMAEKVARALVMFDLDLAQAELTGRDEELVRPLSQLLDNLRSYRPYLPEVLFEVVECDGGASPAPQGEVAIVFTDIQSSTSLWEECPTGMRKAIQVHDRVIRGCLQRHDGYEVKTIGDAFMVAFTGVEGAVGFGLEVQDALYHSKEWPEELLEHPLCQVVEELWNGLRVRIGVHAGEADMRLNPVTGRADYFGPTVNVAARVEGQALGGTVAVTGSVHTTLIEEGVLERLAGPEVLHLGGKELKGVAGLVDIHLLVPCTLERRLCQQGASLALHTVSTEASHITLPSDPQGASADLRLVSGTVGCASIDYTLLDSLPHPGGHVTQAVAAVLDAVERTAGTLLNVASSSITVGWNVKRRVANHSTQAALFSGHLHRNLLSTAWTGRVTVGLATGTVLHGSVGTEVQRFIVAIGRCCELAGELSMMAATLQAFAVVGAQQGHHSLADDPLTGKAVARVVGYVDGEPVYQLRVECLGNGVEGESMDARPSWGWSEGYTIAFEAEDVDTLRKKAEEEGDVTLRHIALQLTRP